MGLQDKEHHQGPLPCWAQVSKAREGLQRGWGWGAVLTWEGQILPFGEKKSAFLNHQQLLAGSFIKDFALISHLNVNDSAAPEMGPTAISKLTLLIYLACSHSTGLQTALGGWGGEKGCAPTRHRVRRAEPGLEPHRPLSPTPVC